jgi:hypothetical protein
VDLLCDCPKAASNAADFPALCATIKRLLERP